MNKLSSRAIALALGLGAAAITLSTTVSAQGVAEVPAPIVRVQETIPLAEAFPEIDAAQDYVFRARQLVLGPGARTEEINHVGRPSITYVTQGVVREHRTGAGEPIIHNVGAATMDRGSVTHFWENAGPGEAVLLVVEVMPRAAQ